MSVLPINNQNYKPKFTAALHPDLHNKLKLMAKDKTDLKALKFHVDRIAGFGDKNTIISVYNNSKKTFNHRRAFILGRLNRYFGTFISFSNNLAPSKEPFEMQLSSKTIQLNLHLIKRINSEMVAKAESELCKSELENGAFKSAADYFESKSPKPIKNKKNFWKPLHFLNRK